jgi:hypothetical protein
MVKRKKDKQTKNGAGRISSSRSTGGTCRVTLVKNACDKPHKWTEWRDCDYNKWKINIREYNEGAIKN